MIRIHGFELSCVRSCRSSTVRVCILAVTLCFGAAAQDTSIASPSNNQNDARYVIKADVNQALVRVVVRDSRGQVVGGLKKEDFSIFDNGKQRPIVSFSESHSDSAQPSTADTSAHPGTFTIYLFDDMHMKPEELRYARNAAEAQAQHLNPQSSERVAIFSSSGNLRQAFTNDPSSIHSALSQLKAQERKLEDESSCPYMNYYMARRLETDSDAKATLITETIKCLNFAMKGMAPGERCSAVPQLAQASPDCEVARQAVDAEMRRQLVAGEMDGWKLVSALDGAMRQLANVSGERKIVLFSPGFTVEPRLVEVRIDRALQAGITVDVIDARGLAADPLYDASQGRFSQRMTPFIRASEKARFDVLTQITEGTGGKLYKNNNDLGEALEKAAGTPESYYLLAFSPGQVKNNGSFHQIKVQLANGLKYEISARKGYYEPGKRAAAEQQSAQALAEFFFSQEQRRDIPVDVAVYFGRSTGDGHLDLGKPNSDGTFATFVDTRISIQSLRYRREKDRLVNVLTEVCGVFDQNGDLLAASQNTTNLRLTRAQISKLKSGVSVKSSFQLKAGLYVMRFVLQDHEGKMVSARSVAVEIK